MSVNGWVGERRRRCGVRQPARSGVERVRSGTRERPGGRRECGQKAVRGARGRIVLGNVAKADRGVAQVKVELARVLVGARGEGSRREAHCHHCWRPGG